MLIMAESLFSTENGMLRSSTRLQRNILTVALMSVMLYLMTACVTTADLLEFSCSITMLIS